MVKAEGIEGLLAFEEMNGLEHGARDMRMESVRRPSRVDSGWVSEEQACLF